MIISPVGMHEPGHFWNLRYLIVWSYMSSFIPNDSKQELQGVNEAPDVMFMVTDILMHYYYEIASLSRINEIMQNA